MSGQGLPTADAMVPVYCRQVGKHNDDDYHSWVWLGELIKCDPAGRTWGGRGFWQHWALLQCNGRCEATLRVCLEGQNGVSHALLPDPSSGPHGDTSSELDQ